MTENEEKSLEILHQLSLNARESFANIGSNLGLSRQVVSYNISSLEEKKIIEGYYAILNISRLGYAYYRIFIKLKSISEAIEQKIIQYCSSHLKIGWVIQHHGNWDLAFITWAKDIQDFQEVLDDIMENFGDNISKKEISIATKIYHLKHKFLVNKKDDQALILESEDTIQLDPIDYEILGILTQSARKTYQEIGEILQVSPTNVKNRILYLQKEKVILGYHVKLNHKLLGYTHTKVFLKLKQYSRSSIHEVTEYLKSLISTIYITRSIGSADLEFEILVKNNEEIHQTMRALRFKFSDVIDDYQTLAIYYEPYINYLPVKKFSKYQLSEVAVSS